MSVEAYVDESTDTVYVLLGTGEYLAVEHTGETKTVFEVPGAASALVDENQSYEEAYNEGYDSGYSDGEDNGYTYTEDEVDNARQEGYDEGYEQATQDLAVESDDE